MASGCGRSRRRRRRWRPHPLPARSRRAGGGAGPAQRAARRHGAKSDPLDATRPPVKPWAVTSSPSPGPPASGQRSRCG
jgi:hypothetical protein